MMRVFVGTVLVHMRNTLARPMFQIVLIFQPFVIATTTYLIYRDADVENLVAFVVLGGGLAGIWSAMTFSSVGDIDRERRAGTLTMMMAAPSPLVLIFTAKIAANALLSLLSLGIAFVYSMIIMNEAFSVPHGAAFAVALVLFLFSTSAFALALSSLFLLSRSTGVMQNVLESPLLLLGGMAFPVTVLPAWARAIAAVFPMRWGSEALHAAFDAGPLGADWRWAVLWTLVNGMIYYALALLLFRRIEYRVRQMGNLELV